MPSAILFEDVTAEVGLSYVGASFGASWGDIDGDGLPDLWAGGHAPRVLLLNQAAARFVDVGAVLPDEPREDTHGSAFADFDNDGDQDLLQLCGGGRGRGGVPSDLYLNIGEQVVEVAEPAGLSNSIGRGRTPLWFDADRDGRLDVLINNARREDAPSVLYLQSEGRFRRAAEAFGFLAPVKSEFALLTHLNDDDELYLALGQPFPQRIYQVGREGLVDVSPVFDASRELVTDGVFADFDGDLDQDLILVRGGPTSSVERRSPTTLAVRLQGARSTRDFRFRAEGPVTIDLLPRHRDWWEIGRFAIGSEGRRPDTVPVTLSPWMSENQGLPSAPPAGEKAVHIGYEPEGRWWTIRSVSTAWESVNAIVEAEAFGETEWVAFEPYESRFRPRLIRNDRGRLVECAEGFEIGDSLVNAFAAGAGDFDNDMDLDLYVVCSGGISNAPNVLFENTGGGRFRPVAGFGAEGSSAGQGDAVAVADYDVDGFLDLFVTNGRGLRPFSSGPHELFRNRGNGNHWIEIDLEGTVSNRDGIGARVVVTAGGTSQVRTQTNGIQDRAQNHSRLHFGLGPHRRADRIHVAWPSGGAQVLENVDGDQVVHIVEPDSDRR